MILEGTHPVKRVMAEGTVVGPWTTDNIEEMKPVFKFCCADVEFVANTLDEAAQLWFADGLDGGPRTLLSVDRIG